MSEPRRPRLFFALWPGAATRAALDGSAAKVPLGRARRTQACNLHLTLVFVGAVDPPVAEACAAAAAGVAGDAFELAIDVLGHFPRARVAWLGPRVEPPALSALVAALEARLTAARVRFDARPFRPHVTIAREVPPLADPPAVAPVHWPVADFALLASVPRPDGNRYEVRANWPLRPAARGETAR